MAIKTQKQNLFQKRSCSLGQTQLFIISSSSRSQTELTGFKGSLSRVFVISQRPPSGPSMTPSNAHSMPTPLPSFFQANLTHRSQHQHHRSLSPPRRADKSPEAAPLMNGRELQTSGHRGAPRSLLSSTAQRQEAPPSCQ